MPFSRHATFHHLIDTNYWWFLRVDDISQAGFPSCPFFMLGKYSYFEYILFTFIWSFRLMIWYTKTILSPGAIIRFFDWVDDIRQATSLMLSWIWFRLVKIIDSW